MFSPEEKRIIAMKVQAALQELLPDREFQFILHVDGNEDWLWTNIYNNGSKNDSVPAVLCQNLSKGE